MQFLHNGKPQKVGTFGYRTEYDTFFYIKVYNFNKIKKRKLTTNQINPFFYRFRFFQHPTICIPHTVIPLQRYTSERPYAVKGVIYAGG